MRIVKEKLSAIQKYNDDLTAKNNALQEECAELQKDQEELNKKREEITKMVVDSDIKKNDISKLNLESMSQQEKMIALNK